MADEQSTPGPFPAMMQEFIGQLRAAAENAGKPHPVAQASAATPALPGALSAAQMASITDGISDQRRSIAALQTQLSTFDQQLAALETMLGPLAQWSKSWADIEQQFMNMRLKPGAGG